ncbi:MAG: cytochrome c [Pseudomonadota bacterium]
MLKHSRNNVLTTLALSIVCTGFAFAHEGAKGVIKERMDSMKTIAASMKTISQMIRKPETFDKAKATEAIARVSAEAQRTTSLYPSGSLEEPSEARAAIWNNPDRFRELAKEFELRVSDLAKTITSAQTADSLIEDFKAVGSTCSDCHTEFRVRK